MDAISAASGDAALTPRTAAAAADANGTGNTTAAAAAAAAAGAASGSLGLQPCEPRFGALSHAAPELILGQELSKASDVYSIGVLLWEMLTGQVSFVQAG